VSSTNTATVLAQHGNVGVVALPGRQFPALAIQGDTFAILVRDLETALSHRDITPALVDDLRLVHANLVSMQRLDEETLASAGLPLPYQK
jgi:hypothetical protein